MRKRALITFAVAVVVALVLWQLVGHSTPAGQVPLTNVVAENVGDFERQFNQAADQPRVLLLLSPT